MSKDLKTSPLTAHTGFWMRLVSNHVSHGFARGLEKSGVTVAEWVILREMFAADGVTSPGLIAGFTGLSKGAISKLITRLLEKGLVSREEAEKDRRYQDIQLSAKGRALVPKLARIADENDERFFSVLSAKERQLLKDILLKLSDEHQLKTRPTE